MGLPLSTKSVEYAKYVEQIIAQLRQRGQGKLAENWQRLLPQTGPKAPARMVNFNGNGLWAQWYTPKGKQVTVSCSSFEGKNYLSKTVSLEHTAEGKNELGLSKIMRDFESRQYSYTLDGTKILNVTPQQANEDFQWIREGIKKAEEKARQLDALKAEADRLGVPWQSLKNLTA